MTELVTLPRPEAVVFTVFFFLFSVKKAAVSFLFFSETCWKRSCARACSSRPHRGRLMQHWRQIEANELRFKEY